MSKVAIIVGFDYAALNVESGENDVTNQLRGSTDRAGLYSHFPGAIVDLYRAYRWAKMIDCDKILVVTDNTTKPITEAMIEMMVTSKMGETDTVSDFFTFMSNLRKEGMLWYYTNIEEYEKKIVEVAKDALRLFFYYSGHGEYGQLLFPRYSNRASYDGTNGADLLFPDRMISAAIHSSHSDSQIVVLFDTCDCNGVNCPYEWIEADETSLDGLYQYRGIDRYAIYEGRDLIVISSSALSSYSLATGSPFTTQLFAILENQTFISIDQLLIQLRKALSHYLTMNPMVHASSFRLTSLPYWFLHPSTLSLQVDRETMTVVVRY